MKVLEDIIAMGLVHVSEYQRANKIHAMWLKSDNHVTPCYNHATITVNENN